jgi:hypothetical protein
VDYLWICCTARAEHSLIAINQCSLTQGTILRNFCIAPKLFRETLAATTQIRLAAAMEWH